MICINARYLSVLSSISAAKDSSTIYQISAVGTLDQDRANSYIVSSMRHKNLLLLPKEEDPEPFHQRRKLIVNVLQYFGSYTQSLQELAVRIHDLFGDAKFYHTL